MDDHEVEQDFEQKLEQEQARQTMKRPNVLVCGYTGSGKSSLIKAVCGDVVPDDAIGDGKPKTVGYDIYESDNICVWDSKGLELGETEEDFTGKTREFIRARQSDANVDHHIHIVWYTIQGPGARVTACDLNLIQRVFSPESVVVVITKSDITRVPQLTQLRAELCEAGVDPERIVAVSDVQTGAVGCRELVALTHKLLPGAYRASFAEAQRVDREARLEAVRAKRSKASAIITATTAAATGVAAIPIPLADSALLVPMQTTMIASLAVLYGLHAEAIKHAALPFVARVAGIHAAGSLLKLIPGLGSIVSATVAGAITRALGWYTQDCFADMAIAKINGAPVPTMNFDVDTFREYYRDFRKTKK